MSLVPGRVGPMYQFLETELWRRTGNPHRNWKKASMECGECALRRVGQGRANGVAERSRVERAGIAPQCPWDQSARYTPRTSGTRPHASGGPHRQTPGLVAEDSENHKRAVCLGSLMQRSNYLLKVVKKEATVTKKGCGRV